MRNKMKMLLLHMGYYVLCVPIYAGAFLAAAILFMLMVNFGNVWYLPRYLLLVAAPIIVGTLTRFSFLKWYVDPIAALEVPLVIYAGSILLNVIRWDVRFYDSFLAYNGQLSADGGKGWFFLLGLFVIGLVTSFSLARKRGESISYRGLSKFLK